MSNKKRILIAEDNSVLGDVIRFNLQRSGFDVTLARNGEEAFQEIALKNFDVLVTDYEMPGMNGEELCTRVRTELGNDDVHMVMCTAKGMGLDREGLKSKLRIEEILFKPFSIRDLTSLLQKLASTPPSNPSLLSLTS